MIELLAALSASAAGGMRIALPLLLIGLLKNNLWSDVPFLSAFSPQVVVGTLVSWSLFELFASKKFLGQRILQLVQLLLSPLVGAIMGLAIAEATHFTPWLVWLVGIIGGLFALVLQLVQAGWFYRLRGLPLWAIFLQDTLCISLVIFAFDAPEQGGLIALLLLWLAIRSSKEWYRWYTAQADRRNRHHPRRYKCNPD
ncbi:DUF4126 domain-containing protein [Lyngbya sp. CCY1209]|jgi:hypothetical protein|uniref:DUF4126 domain-containing protein n=1 Tax=Lyngbya sp. CCY1209 TaxID=2886103 RepID=UPI002D20D3B3|nr:DUF4126 domain-containing protein [Lyngbya sp. CCY1209]MEB3883373.1 DUF4126 domain-containing protein [Lyngbya sp. CCY1209]